MPKTSAIVTEHIVDQLNECVQKIERRWIKNTISRRSSNPINIFLVKNDNIVDTEECTDVFGCYISKSQNLHEEIYLYPERIYELSLTGDATKKHSTDELFFILLKKTTLHEIAHAELSSFTYNWGYSKKGINHLFEESLANAFALRLDFTKEEVATLKNFIKKQHEHYVKGLNWCYIKDDDFLSAMANWRLLKINFPKEILYLANSNNHFLVHFGQELLNHKINNARAFSKSIEELIDHKNNNGNYFHPDKTENSIVNQIPDYYGLLSLDGIEMNKIHIFEIILSPNIKYITFQDDEIEENTNKIIQQDIYTSKKWLLALRLLVSDTKDKNNFIKLTSKYKHLLNR